MGLDMKFEKEQNQNEIDLQEHCLAFVSQENCPVELKIKLERVKTNSFKYLFKMFIQH
jgi:hypothetical protein